MKAVRTNEKGFSLVELMIVVAIIGILSTIAVPNFKKFSAKAKQTEAKAALSAVFSANKSFFAEWNVYRNDFRDIGYSPEGRMLYTVGFPTGASVSPGGNFIPSTNGGAAADACRTSVTASCSFTATVAAGNPSALATVAVPSGAAAGCAAAAAADADSFAAQANGGLQSTNTDVWTITENKALCNLRDGTL